MQYANKNNLGRLIAITEMLESCQKRIKYTKENIESLKHYELWGSLGQQVKQLKTYENVEIRLKTWYNNTLNKINQL